MQCDRCHKWSRELDDGWLAVLDYRLCPECLKKFERFIKKEPVGDTP